MILLYGANGYTGSLIVQLARQQGLALMLAGRRAEAIAPLAAAAGMPWRAFGLDDPGALRDSLEGVTAVLHCAGPFARTARPMVDACLARGVHYLDITGELEVFEALAARHQEACAASVVLLPGVGFDVVPTDCLAVHLKRRLPTATHLQLAFRASGGVSHGTATTMIENIGRGGVIREGGRLRQVRAAHRIADFDLGRGPEPCVTIPWGDLATAWRSTGIPNITTWVASPTGARVSMLLSRHLGAALASAPAQRLLKGWIDRQAPGPDDATRARARARVCGVAWDDQGRRVTSRLQTPEAYTFTALAALEAARRVAQGEVEGGCWTPAMAFGPDFVLGFEGVQREDVDTRETA